MAALSLSAKGSRSFLNSSPEPSALPPETITRAAVSKFLADRAHIGELFLGKYLIWKSSGSSGETGIFVQDRAALSVYDSLLAVQMQSARVASRYAWGLFAQGGRAALVVATGDHFASIASRSNFAPSR